MSKRQIRRLTDSTITVGFLAAVWMASPWWLVPLAAAFGMWNFYDGQTRMDLPDA